MSEMPAWNVPGNLAQALEEGDGFWEDERWSPILLTAMSDILYQGREIPVAWQIEFDPYNDELLAAGEQLAELELEPDGYGWAEYILHTLRNSHPNLAERINTLDCEVGTCVIWVEHEADCRVVVEETWRLLFAG